MSQLKTYLTLLEDIAQKKENLLGKMIIDTMKQANCFKEDEFDEAKYDICYDNKIEMLREIESLDEGFQSLYERIKDEMKAERYACENEIKELQERIRRITEKGLKLQKLEQDNKLKFEHMMNRQRQQIKEYHVSKKTAATYYKNMMKQFSNESVFYSNKR